MQTEAEPSPTPHGRFERWLAAVLAHATVRERAAEAQGTTPVDEQFPEDEEKS